MLKTQTRIWLFWLITGLLFLWFLASIKAILLPFVVGMMLAYFLDPAADKLENWGCSRTVATTIITLSFFSLLILLLSWLAPIVVKQAGGFIKAIPQYIELWKGQFGREIDTVVGWVNNVQHDAKVAPQEATSAVTSHATKLIGGLLDSTFALINLISLIVIMPIVSFYLLRDWDRMVEKMDALLPRQYADIIRDQVEKIDQTLAGFLRGTVNVMLILGTFYAIALTVVGLKFAIIIGLLGGFLIIIPYLGTIISGAAAVGMAYLQFGDDTTSVIIVLAIFVIGQMLEGYVLTPKLVGDKVGLHPLWLIFGMLAGATLFGFVGIFLAVPVTAVIGVLVRFAIEQYKLSDYYTSDEPLVIEEK